MDGPGLSWPAWKFGMRRDELFTTLHDQYNTFPSSIQDPDAFHHDVYEISSKATTTEDFHLLMAGRKTQRLAELNESLESASVEIIANPSLIGTTQWEYALQLFRTRSLDSLVRLFASYLPANHTWHHQMGDDALNNTAVSAVEKPMFDHRGLTDEPASFTSSSMPDLPPSPRSLTLCSDHCPDLSLTPRTLSFSDSEPDQYGDDDLKCGSHHYHDDVSSQFSGPETPASISELGDELEHGAHTAVIEILSGYTDKSLSTKHPGEGDDCITTPMQPDSATSPPKTASSSTSVTPAASCAPIFFDIVKPTPLSSRHRGRSMSPSRCLHLHDVAMPADQVDCRHAAPTHRPLGRLSRVDYESAAQHGRQGQRCHSTTRIREARHREAAGRIQKARPMQTRMRERKERETGERHNQ